MSGMSRRDLLRASAGAAAVAVPMSVLSSEVAGASGRSAAAAAAATSAAATEHQGPALAGPVVFSVVDARAGEVSILHGTSEVIVRDPDLVARIMRAARRAV